MIRLPISRLFLVVALVASVGCAPTATGGEDAGAAPAASGGSGGSASGGRSGTGGSGGSRANLDAGTAGSSGGGGTTGSAGASGGRAGSTGSTSNRDAGDELVFVDGGLAAGPPPAPWQGKDIGEGATGGGLDGRHNGWKPTGSGTGIGGTKDSFYFIHHPFTGDGEIMGRVDTSGTRVGLMVRASLEPNAPFVLLGLNATSPEGSFLRRTTADAMATETMVRAAYYIKITRKGNTFTAWGNSGDRYQAERWQMLGTVDITMPTTAFAGLAIAGSNTVVLRGPRITTGLPANLRHLQVYHQGDVATYQNGVLTLNGWGDVFGSREGVTLAGAPVMGAHTVTAKLTSQSSTDSRAHAGVMFREGGTDNSFLEKDRSTTSFLHVLFTVRMGRINLT